jgi:hypothetical protein
MHAGGGINVDKEKVLSYSGDRDALIQRERVLRRSGFDVVSVESESQARFEIEMGSCGILLICFRTHTRKDPRNGGAIQKKLS